MARVVEGTTVEETAMIGNGGWKNWTIGVLLAIVFAFAGTIWTGQLATTANLSTIVSAQVLVNATQSERIARLEERYLKIEESLKRIEQSVLRGR